MIEDDRTMKRFHVVVKVLLQSLLEVYTSEAANSHIREQILEVVFLSLRTVSWADGIDDKLV